MKSLISVLLTVFAATLLLPSCKKSSSDPQTPVVNPISLIREIRVTDTLGTLFLVNVLEYDSSKRLKTISSLQCYPNDTVRYTYTLVYTAGQVVMSRLNPAFPQDHYTITYYLASSGLADSAVYRNWTGNGDTTLMSYAYHYDGNGYLQTLIVTTHGSGGGSMICHWNGHNVDYQQGVPAGAGGKFLFFYDASHYNSISNAAGGVGFLGTSCANPLVKTRIDGLTLDVANFTYQYDSQGRISQLRNDGSSIIPCTDFYTFPYLMGYGITTYTYY
jgi:hypothetical protein